MTLTVMAVGVIKMMMGADPFMVRMAAGVIRTLMAVHHTTEMTAAGDIVMRMVAVHITVMMAVGAIGILMVVVRSMRRMVILITMTQAMIMTRIPVHHLRILAQKP